MALNLEWLRTFKAIYETGTLSAAAQVVYISQPGVSLHLNALETYTGYKLFDRLARKMVPTEKGKVFYNFILEPLTKLESAEQIFHKSSKTERATLSVGMCFETFQFTLEQHMSKLPFNLIIKFGSHEQMQHDLDSGSVDLIVTHHKSDLRNLDFTPFSKEKIILVAGSNTHTKELEGYIQKGKIELAKKFLKSQLWYSTAADMEHLGKFWRKNFNEHPDFKPNFIVPNISSIVRCLSASEGFSIIPDFLCKEAIEQKKIRLVWQGADCVENTLFFGTRKKTMLADEISKLQKIFLDEWQPLTI